MTRPGGVVSPRMPDILTTKNAIIYGAGAITSGLVNAGCGLIAG